jgi:hypothetical protein
MTSTKIGRRTSHAVLAGVASVLALAVPAHATTLDTRPDLVVEPYLSHTEVTNSAGQAGYSVTVYNDGQTWAASNQLKVTFQPVSRFYLNGQYYYYNTPGTSPIVTTGTVPPLADLDGRTVGVNMSSAVVGYNRVTACVDSTNVVNESNESNNCRSQIENMVIDNTFYGG